MNLLKKNKQKHEKAAKLLLILAAILLTLGISPAKKAKAADYTVDNFIDLKHYLSDASFGDNFTINLTDNIDITEPIIIRNNVNICGNGHTLTNKIKSDNSTNMLAIESGTIVEIQELELNGNRNADESGFPWNSRNVIARSYKEKWNHCIYVAPSGTLTIIGSDIHDAWNHGICVYGTLNAKDCTFHDNNFSGVQMNISVEGGLKQGCNVTLDECYIYGNGHNDTNAEDKYGNKYGTTYDGLIINSAKKVVISNCYIGMGRGKYSDIHGNYGHGISVNGNTDITVENTVITAGDIKNVHTNDVYNGIYAHKSENGSPTLTVKNCTIRDCGQNGIAIGDGTLLYISETYCIYNNHNGLLAENNSKVYRNNGTTSCQLSYNGLAGLCIRGNSHAETKNDKIYDNGCEAIIIEDSARLYATDVMAHAQEADRYAAVRITSNITSGDAPLTLNDTAYFSGSINLTGYEQYPYVATNIKNLNVAIWCEKLIDKRRVLSFTDNSCSDKTIKINNEINYPIAKGYRDGNDIRLCTGHTVSVEPNSDVTDISGSGTYYYGRKYSVTAYAPQGNSIRLEVRGRDEKGSFGSSSTISGTMLHDDVALFTTVKATDYKLTLNSNGGIFSDGGKIEKELTVNYGHTNYNNISKYAPSMTGYKFDGWYTDAEGGTKVFSSDGSCVNGCGFWSDNKWCHEGNLTVYAHWVDVTPPEITYHKPIPGIVPDPDNPTPGGEAVTDRELNLEYDWTNRDVLLHFTANDYGSGMDSFVLYDQNSNAIKNGTVNSHTASVNYTATTEGITRYTLVAKDKAGNSTKINITVKIDKTLPEGIMTVCYSSKQGSEGQIGISDLSRTDKDQYMSMSAVFDMTEPAGEKGATPSGIKSAKVIIANNDREITNEYEMTISGDGLTASLTIDILTDDFYNGDIGYLAYAEDYAGNTFSIAENFEQLTLTTGIESKFYDGITYLQGEALILSIRTTGYVEKVVVSFPVGVKINGKDEPVFSYTYDYKYDKPDIGLKEEKLEFLLPLYMDEKSYLDSEAITITAYRDDTDNYNPSEDIHNTESLTRYETFTVRGSILDYTRTRLR